MKLAAISAVLFAAGMMPAAATEEFDACVRKLCVSTDQTDCWVKGGAALCDRNQIHCQELLDQAPVKVLRKVGDRWEVETQYGKGWVSDRMTMVSGDMC